MGMHSLFILGLWFRRIGSVTRYFIHNSPKLFLIRKMAQKIGRRRFIISPMTLNIRKSDDFEGVV